MSERDEQRGDPEVGVCHVCGQIFDTQMALSEHLMERHPDDLLPTEPQSESR